MTMRTDRGKITHSSFPFSGRRRETSVLQIGEYDTTKKRPEVLVPAGLWKRSESRCKYGANAVFVGGQAMVAYRYLGFCMDELREVSNTLTHVC